MKLGQQAMEALKSQIDGALELGDDLVVAGVIAIEGTQILIEKEKEKLLGYFSDGFLWNAARTLEKCRVPEMASESFREDIHARYDLGTGGVLSGLWKMTEASGTGLRADLRRIPVRISGHLRHSFSILHFQSVLCTEFPTHPALFQVAPVYMVRKNICSQFCHRKSFQSFRQFHDPVVSIYAVNADSCFVSSI